MPGKVVAISLDKDGNPVLTNSGSGAVSAIISSPANEFVAMGQLSLPTAGTKILLQLWNPSASGVNLTVTYVALNASPSAQINIFAATAALTTQDTTYISNKNLSGSAPSAEIYTDEDANPAGLFGATRIEASKEMAPVYGLTGLIIPPGTGLAFKAAFNNIRLAYEFNWTETEV